MVCEWPKSKFNTNQVELGKFFCGFESEDSICVIYGCKLFKQLHQVHHCYNCEKAAFQSVFLYTNI